MKNASIPKEQRKHLKMLGDMAKSKFIVHVKPSKFINKINIKSDICQKQMTLDTLMSQFELVIYNCLSLNKAYNWYD